MTEALSIIYQIYDKFVNMVFNQLEVAPNVTIGWIATGIN